MRRLLLIVALCGCGDDNPGTTPGDDAACEACDDGGVPDAPIAPIGAYVSAMTGDDTNAGTQDAPVKTIGKGIANAMMLGGARSVIVAGGTYDEKVTLVEGIDLLGGHRCNPMMCDWVRDIATHKTTITNTDFEGVVAGAGVTQATLISGFTITGLAGAPGSQTGTVGLTMNGGSPTVRANVIVGASTAGNTGSDANNRSIGIAVRGTTDPAGAVIENNDISSGAAVQSIGVAIESASPAITSLVTLSSNVIKSGTGRRSIGVFALRAATGSKIVNNDVTSGGTQGGAATGIQVNSPVAVERNRVNLDRAATGACTQTQSWCAGVFVEGATTQLVNNIVLGPRGFKTAGLVLAELEFPAGTVTVANNYLDGGGTGANTNGGPRSTSSAVVVQISNNTAAQLTGSVGRIGNNILAGGINSDRFGIREDAPANRKIHPVFVNSNLFWFTPLNFRSDSIYREIGDGGFPIDYSAVFLFEGNSPISAQDNDEGDPELDASWHISDTSPCLDTGTDTDAPATDFEGDARPAGKAIDIGHDER